MSDGYVGRASQASVNNFADALANLGITIGDKIDQMDAQTEYMTGYEALSKGFTDFDQSLRTDPDWRSYQDKASANDQQLFDTVMKGMKNNTAKQQLTTDFESMKLKHYSSIADLQTTKKIQDIATRYDALRSNYLKTGDAAKLGALYTDMANSGIYDEDKLSGQRDEDLHDADLQNLTAKSLAVMQQQGPDAALSFAMDPRQLGQYQHLGQNDQAQAGKYIEQQYGIAQKLQEDKQKQIDEQTYGKFVDMKLTGNYGADVNQKIAASDMSAGKKVLAMHLFDPKNGQHYDPSVYDALAIKVANHGQPLTDAQRSEDRDEIENEFAEGVISPGNRESLLKQLDPSTKLSEFQSKLVQSIASPDPASKSVYEREQASLAKWFSENPGADPSEQTRQAQLFSDMAGREVSIAAVQKLYSAGEMWTGFFGGKHQQENEQALTDAVNRFGGQELSAMAKAGDAAAVHVQDLAKQDFTSKFQKDLQLEASDITADSPGLTQDNLKSVAQFESKSNPGYLFQMAYDPSTKLFSWWAYSPEAKTWSNLSGGAQ